MLVLTRKKGQSIKIGDDIIITIIDSKGEGVRIGIDAPKDLAVFRSELVETVKGENREAASVNIEVLKSFLRE